MYAGANTVGRMWRQAYNLVSPPFSDVMFHMFIIPQDTCVHSCVLGMKAFCMSSFELRCTLIVFDANI